MYLSMGNLNANPQVGLLFISFETPRRVRMQGMATVSRDPALLALYKEADLVVSVKLTELWINCSRYVPKYEDVYKRQVIRRLTFIRPIIFPPGVDQVLANPTNAWHMIVLDLSGKI